MRFTKVCAVVALLGLASSALAEDVVVERRRSSAGIVLRDTIGGALVGSAVSGGIILYNMGIQNRSDYDWGRTLAWGALIGLGAGLVWGIVDASSGPSYARLAPSPAPLIARDGLSMSLDTRRRDQSGVQQFALLARRF